ncbi:MAG: ATP-binding cassette domain-containing protein [Acidimicrobiales bacterium]
MALRDANADIDKGEFVFLVGPSGSGKSTFLRLVNKQEEPDAGRIFVAGKDIGKLSSWKCRCFGATSATSFGLQTAPDPNRCRKCQLCA